VFFSFKERSGWGGGGQLLEGGRQHECHRKISVVITAESLKLGTFKQGGDRSSVFQRMVENREI